MRGMSLFSRLSGSSRTREESSTQRAIRCADAARDRRDWDEAAEQYRIALKAEEDQPHIWLQLGHALKEQGRLREALQAYLQATSRAPCDADAHVHLAHLYKRLDDDEAAIAHFLRAMHFGIHSKGEERELLSLMARQAELGRHATLADAVEALEHLPRGDEAPILSRLRGMLFQPTAASTEFQPTRSGTEGPAMVFDISDLIGFWRAARLPTGIQRVQIEAIIGALDQEDGRSVRLCCFTTRRDEWLEVPVDAFRLLAALATKAGALDDADWAEALSDLDLHLTLTRPFVFPFGAMLINLGTSWWLQNYFLFVRQAKKERGIRYVPFVHDMIPIITPEHCVEALTEDFISWALGVFDHADHFLVNSRATAKDLRAVAATLGHDLSQDDIAVITLDSDFRKIGSSALGADALGQWQLEAGNFVLFVSTVESRKGHLTAFEAWADLTKRLGADNVPQLVCVGNRGWKNDEVYERLAGDIALSRKVTMLSGLSDAELALLYRDCRFTLYPSLYEGWGLPVTESLCYGKVPLISDAASLPEAGGRFAVYFKAGDQTRLAHEAQRLICDDGHRATLESRIGAEFSPRSWQDLAADIGDKLERFARRDEDQLATSEPEPSAPVAKPGNWYPLVRNRSTRIWPGMRTAEGFRSDLGWHWPEDRGCRVRGTGARLTMQFDAEPRRLRLYVALLGDETVPTHYRIRLGDAVREGILEAHERAWTWLDFSSGSLGQHVLGFEALAMPDGTHPTYFVRGFFPCIAEDLAMRQNFLEAVTLNRLDLFDAYRDLCEGPNSSPT